MIEIYEKGFLPNGDEYTIYITRGRYELFINMEFCCKKESYEEINNILNKMLGK